MKVRTRTVYQMEIAECGAASLGIVLLYHGCYVPLERLRVDTGVTRDGCNAYYLLLGAQKYGLRAEGIRCNAKTLAKKTFPCIIHWNHNHFVVLEGFDKRFAYINDPARGRYRVTLDDFEKCYSKTALLFEPTEDFKKTGQRPGIRTIISDRLYRQKDAVIALAVTGILMLGPCVIIPFLLRYFADVLLANKQTGTAVYIAMIMTAALAVRVLLMIYAEFVRERFCRKVSVLSTRNLTEHIFRLPVSFFEQRYLGDIIARERDNDRLNDFLIRDLSGTVIDLFSSAVFLIILVSMNIYMSVIVVLFAAAIIIMAISGNIRTETLSELNCTDGARFGGLLLSGLGIMTTVKASGAGDGFATRLVEGEKKVTDSGSRIGYVRELMNTTGISVKIIADALILIAGAYLAVNGTVTAGGVIAFILIFEMFCSPLVRLSDFLCDLKLREADLCRVKDIEMYEESRTFQKGSETSVSFGGKIVGRIDVRSVSFGYNTLYEPVVSDISFHLDPGRSLALVGGTGSGKSTVGKILSGLYLPWEGEVLLDGIPRSRIAENVLSASVATVSQNVVLFGGRIRDNITMWNRNILEEDMISAAKDACIHDVIMSKAGAYDYILSENGANLSGGQRQRIEIARALALNPSVLIMDEATSALDPITEKKIIDNIKKRGITCVIVAHRLSAIRDCDLIMVLENGTVKERGSHDELMAEDGLYRKLVENN